MTYDPLAWLDDALARLRHDHLLRRTSMRQGAQGRLINMDGSELINFGANDYLGLAGDPRLSRAASQALELSGWGSGASPLVSGRTAAQSELEQALARFEQTEAALVFPTGFAANVGTLCSLVDRDDVVFSDRNNHASLIDGCRLTRAAVQVYDVTDLSSLRSALRAARMARRRLIVTDSIFSMDGSLAPLADLVALAEEYDAMLMVDEAHATGVFGEHGRGVCEYLAIEHRVPIRIGTLSKAVGSIGGFVVGEQRLIDWIFNRARTQVFSTALPAACHAASLAGLQLIHDEPERRIELLQQADAFRAQLAADGLTTGNSVGQIVPVVLGDAAVTMRIAERLRDWGLFVPGIRPPTVRHGTARLRISLSWAHTPVDRDRLTTALRNLAIGKSTR